MSVLGSAGGIWMLVLLGILTVTTGLPVWSLLIGISSIFAVAGLVAGVVDVPILSAVPPRLVGVLDNDLLQALPLYVLVGMLLQRLALADALFSTLTRGFWRLGGGSALASLGVGALIAPMNGSVASSSALLARLVAPRLDRMDPMRATALVSVAATIGVVVPPSLVLILLGDAMLRAHTEASNLPGFVLGHARIINTQDVFHAALLPGLATLLCWALVSLWQNRGVKARQAPEVSARQVATAVLTGGCIVLLLAGVFAGKLFAVEAAATGGVLLMVFALVTRALERAQWRSLLADTLALTGALVALLVGATVFSLVFRLFGTDRWLSDQLLASPLPALPTAALVLTLVALCAWVLDAFEMIFVLVPIVAPPLIAMSGDAQQTAVLLLQVLQLSFLVPPLGYAVMMARTRLAPAASTGALCKALLPFVLVQLLALGTVFAVPAVVHQMDPPEVPAAAEESDADLVRRMQEMSEPGAGVDVPVSPSAADAKP